MRMPTLAMRRAKMYKKEMEPHVNLLKKALRTRNICRMALTKLHSATCAFSDQEVLRVAHTRCLRVLNGCVGADSILCAHASVSKLILLHVKLCEAYEEMCGCEKQYTNACCNEIDKVDNDTFHEICKDMSELDKFFNVHEISDTEFVRLSNGKYDQISNGLLKKAFCKQVHTLRNWHDIAFRIVGGAKLALQSDVRARARGVFRAKQ